MSEHLKILLVEDVATDAELEIRELKSASLNCIVHRVETRDEFVQALQGFVPDIVLSDFSLPGAFDGLAALDLTRELLPEAPFIFVSGTIGEERAIEAIKRGATDYVLKTNLKRLPTAVVRAIEDARNRQARREVERKLQQSERHFASFMTHLPGVAFMKDLGGRHVFANHMFERIAQRRSIEILGYTDEQIWPPELAREFRDHDRQVLEGNRVVTVVQHTAHAGGIRSWLVHRFPIPDGDGAPALVGGIALDITERLRAEEKVARLSRIREVLSGINSAIVRIRERQELFKEACRIAVEHGRFRMAWIGIAGPGAGKLTPAAWQGAESGYLDEVGKALDRLPEDYGTGGRILRGEGRVVSNDIEADPHIVFKKEALARGYRSLCALPLKVSGQIAGAFLLYSEDKGYFDDDEMALLDELAGDISFGLEYMQKEAQLNYLAYYDGLTGLANRTLFLERVAGVIASAKHEGRTAAVILTDIEHFKTVNDTLGRHVADALLRQTAAGLQTVADEPDNVARIAADCFAVALRDLPGESHLAQILGDLCAPAGRSFMVDGREVRISSKAGVALFPGDGADADTLLKNAEAALKKAKAAGERYLLYAPEMNARVAERLSLETRLRRALEREQFVLHYQPKVDLRTRTIQDLEALIRWNDPDTGLVPPGRFIPVLEETGMVLDAGRWVLRQAVKDHLRWIELGLPPMRVAVNISALQLRRKDFVDEIRQAVELFGERPCGLDLEITESIVMDDLSGNIEKLKAIRDLGVAVAIDDFGTGYSSLAYLARLPIDTLKVDRSFVVNMLSTPDDMTIVSAIISLARALDIHVVAEGVETEEQANLLGLLKCDGMQGFLFSKPLPSEGLEKLLRNRPKPA